MTFYWYDMVKYDQLIFYKEIFLPVVCRAEFDIYHSAKAGGVPVETHQVLVSCTFCGNSILAKNPVSQTGRKLRYAPREIPTNKVKVSTSTAETAGSSF